MVLVSKVFICVGLWMSISWRLCLDSRPHRQHSLVIAPRKWCTCNNASCATAREAQRTLERQCYIYPYVQIEKLPGLLKGVTVITVRVLILDDLPLKWMLNTIGWTTGIGQMMMMVLKLSDFVTSASTRLSSPSKALLVIPCWNRI